MALKSDETVWSWGYNLYGKLGDGTTTYKTTPVQITTITGASNISAGNNLSLILKSDGTVWSCGYNEYGQLGDNTTVNKSTPVQVTGLTGASIISAGGNYSLVLKYDGTVWSWGVNNNGQLGLANCTIAKDSPTYISGIDQVQEFLPEEIIALH
jgi:alpha-tubulin suppressor-like RCC1 family protein